MDSKLRHQLHDALHLRQLHLLRKHHASTNKTNPPESTSPILSWFKKKMKRTPTADQVQTTRAQLNKDELETLDTTKRFLRQVSAFATCSEEELGQLAQLTEIRTFQKSDLASDDPSRNNESENEHRYVIMPNERKADGLYMIMAGTARREHIG